MINIPLTLRYFQFLFIHEIFQSVERLTTLGDRNKLYLIPVVLRIAMTIGLYREIMARYNMYGQYSRSKFKETS